MKRIICTVAVSLLMALGMLAQDSGQGAKQDMKDAGKATKDAAKSTGRATKKTAKKAGRGVKKGVHSGADKVEEKTR